MADPLFWLALSFLLVVVSLTAVLLVAIPAFRELGRAARSAEKFFDTLGRELPPTLEAIRLTGLEITELTDDVTEGVQSAGQVVQQVNQTIVTAQTGAQRLNTGTKSFLAGARAAWQTWADKPPTRPRRSPQPGPDPAALPRQRPEGAADDPGDLGKTRRLEASSLHIAPDQRPKANGSREEALEPARPAKAPDEPLPQPTSAHPAPTEPGAAP